MTKSTTPKETFNYEIPHSIVITMPRIRQTLRIVQEQLLSHGINGGAAKLDMDAITTVKPTNTCKMAACIGGWTSLFLIGFDVSLNQNPEQFESPADSLFETLIQFDHDHGNGRLRDLFYDYRETDDFNEPNVAATAIGRYLRDKEPWPAGFMPNVLPYSAPAKRRARK